MTEPIPKAADRVPHCEFCCYVPSIEDTPGWLATADCVPSECPNLPDYPKQEAA